LAKQENTFVPAIPNKVAVVVECDDYVQLCENFRAEFFENPELESLAEFLDSDLADFTSNGALRALASSFREVFESAKLAPRNPAYAAVFFDKSPQLLVGVQCNSSSVRFNERLKDHIQRLADSISASQAKFAGKAIAETIQSIEFSIAKQEVGGVALYSFTEFSTPTIPRFVQSLALSLRWTIHEKWLLVSTSEAKILSSIKGANKTINDDRSYRLLVSQFSNSNPAEGNVRLFVRPTFLARLIPVQYKELWDSLNLQEIAGIGALLSIQESDLKLDVRVNLTEPRNGVFAVFDRNEEMKLPAVNTKDILFLQAYSFDWMEVYQQFVKSYDAANEVGSSAKIVESTLVKLGYFQDQSDLTRFLQDLGPNIGRAYCWDNKGYYPLTFFELKDEKSAAGFAGRLSTAGTQYDRAYPMTKTASDRITNWCRSEAEFDSLFKDNEQAYGGLSRAEARFQDDANFQFHNWTFVSTFGGLTAAMGGESIGGDKMKSFLDNTGIDLEQTNQFYLRVVAAKYWDRYIEDASYKVAAAERRAGINNPELLDVKKIIERRQRVGRLKLENCFTQSLRKHCFDYLKTSFGKQSVQGFSRKRGLEFTFNFSSE
jgi:hypothetical protein